MDNGGETEVTNQERIELLANEASEKGMSYGRYVATLKVRPRKREKKAKEPEEEEPTTRANRRWMRDIKKDWRDIRKAFGREGDDEQTKVSMVGVRSRNDSSVSKVKRKTGGNEKSIDNGEDNRDAEEWWRIKTD